jgi:hypothetical protein
VTPPRPARGRPPSGPPVPPDGSGLIVLGPADRNGYWRCRCECMAECEARRDNIANGYTQSCGCRQIAGRIAGGIAAAAIRWGTKREEAKS